MPDNIPSLDDLLKNIQEEDEPQSSSALAVVPKEPEDLVEEDIDSQILSILGLEEVFDLTYEEYASLLKEAAVKGRMPGSQMTTESTELITNELKRVKNKTGRFKVKPKKVDINKVLDRKQPTPPGAIVKAEKLIPTVSEVSPEQQKTVVDTENLQGDLIDGIGNILESLITIRTLLQSQGKTEQKSTQEDRKETEKKKKKERESTLEKKKLKLPMLKGLTKPVDDFFAAIKRFFTNVLLGSVVLGMFRWLKDPKNKEAIDGFSNFLQNNAGIILGGLLAIALLPIAPMLLGLTKTLLGGVALLGGALGKLGGLLLKIPGAAPFLGMTVLAPAAGLGATALFAKYGAPVITETAAKLDLGAAAGEDPLIRQAYSQLKEEGKSYIETTGRGGKKVRVEKSTSQMTADEKKNWDAARAKESKVRELAVDFSRSNQDLYNLNQRLKNLQKEKPRNIPGGRSRSQKDINSEIQSVKEEIKVKEKEKSIKKKTLYNYLNIDPNKPQVQPQTPVVPGPSSGATQTDSNKPQVKPQTSMMPGLPASAAQPGTGPVNNKVGSPTRTITPTITSRYGVQRGSKTHGGTDLAVDNGTPLAAVSDGQIIDSGIDPGGWGNFLVFKDNRGINHLYGHIQDGYKKSGSVKKGEVIAKVGMTGRTSGPHLHWESGTGWTGGILTGKFDPLKIYSSTAPFTFDPSIETRLTQAKVSPTPAPTPSIPSPTGRGNIVPLPIPVGGGQQQVSSGSAPNQAPVPRFSSEDPNNATTMVVRAIYNIVG